MKNTGTAPAVMTHVHVDGPTNYVADDAYFWLEPGESRTVSLRLRTTAGAEAADFNVSARAWNVVD